MCGGMCVRTRGCVGSWVDTACAMIELLKRGRYVEEIYL